MTTLTPKSIDISEPSSFRIPERDEYWQNIDHSESEKTRGKKLFGNLIKVEVRNILGPATPDEILLGFIDSPDLKLQKPLLLTISREEKYIVASWLELNLFGYGAHLTDAIEDFRQTLVELFLELDSEPDKLSADLCETYNSLKEWIIKRGA